jgi:hypothetical protein
LRFVRAHRDEIEKVFAHDARVTARDVRQRVVAALYVEQAERAVRGGRARHARRARE